MTATPPAGLPDALIAPWLALTRSARDDAGRLEAQRHYFRELLPKIVQLVETAQEHRHIQGLGTHTLVSLMGFSPETTVIAAAVVRPRKLIVIFGDTEDDDVSVRGSYNAAVDFLVAHRILRQDQIEQRIVDPTDPVDIYRVISSALERTPSVSESRSALVDVTGGKKVMSASAAQAAWELRVPLCYTEGRYDALIRRPRPGTERVMKLASPSTQSLRQMREDALALYASRNYPLAVDAFETSRVHRVENRLDELGALLSRLYVRWTNLDVTRLAEDIGRVRALLDQYRIRLLFDGHAGLLSDLRHHLDALEQVAHGNPPALLASYQELAALYCSNGFRRFDFACLLVYRGMEASIELALSSIASARGRTFLPDEPEWEALTDDVDALQAAYVALARRVHPRRADQALPRRVGLLNGLCLLCVVARVHEVLDFTDVQLVHHIREVADVRNRSVLAHGSRSLTEGNYAFMGERADKLSRAVLGDVGAVVTDLRGRMAPRNLSALHHPAQV